MCKCKESDILPEPESKMGDKTTKEVEQDVIRPPHYRMGGIEPIDYIMSHKMTFPQGSAIKYVTRYKYKAAPIQDLRKAKQCIDFLIAEEEHFQKTGLPLAKCIVE